ncbi:MAG: amidohydrolase family protein [Bryobacteraceae bacterium]
MNLDISDAHVHFFSHGFFTALAAQKRDLAAERPLEHMGQLLGWEMPPKEPEKLAERWVAELDRHGVARAALIASIPGDETSVAAAVARFPSRFHGYFMLNPLAADAQTRLESALAAGMRGVCLFPAMHRFSIADERLIPILRTVAARPGCVVFVHCGVLTVGVRRKLGLPSPFDMRYSNPIDLHPVALQFPSLNFVAPHFGAGYFREALMLCDLCPNVLLDTSSSNGWMKYHAPALDLETVFRRALDVAGAKRLLFGSDSSFFPRGWHAQIFEAQQAALAKVGVSDSDLRLIFGENLANLLTGA